MALIERLYSKIPFSLRQKRKLLTSVAAATLAVVISFCLTNLYSVRPQASGLTATTFTVTNVGDSGPGTLRQAIFDANANPGTDTIAFNILGAGVQTISPTTALPVIVDPVIIDGYTQPGSSANTLADGDNAVLLVELNGGYNVSAGLQINGSNCLVKGLVINRFNSAGIFFSSAVVPSTNTGNVVEGNFIGTDSRGEIALANGDGVDIRFTANTLIGGMTTAARNVISGNASNGIFAATDASATTIQGNFIGTNAGGTTALGNNNSGIFAGGLGNDVIGGTTVGARNLISGNLSNAGIFVQYGSSSAVTIQGNLIGTDVTGTTALGNSFGIWVNHGSSSAATTIGGAAPGARNVISGNRSDGLFISGSTRNSQIQGNLVGTDSSGTKPLGNAGNGIQIDAFAVANKVGGTSAGQANTIAFNGRNGVLVAPGLSDTGNSIRRNSIFSNGALGIDLAGDGVTANDPGDGDLGANNLQNFPMLSTVIADNTRTVFDATLNSAPNTTFTLNLYQSSACDPSGNGEGTTPIVFGSLSFSLTTDANGNGLLEFGMGPLATGQVITATVTDPAGNTSEFSPCDASKATGNVQLSTGSLKVIEDVGIVTVNVLRTGGSKGTLSVDYTTADITATAGSDYMPVAGTLTFNDGETSKTFDIPILDDANTEVDESFEVRLQNGPNVDSLGTPSAEIITLQDHSLPPFLTINSVSITEGDSGTTNALFTVTLTPLTGRTVTVNYQTTAGSATANVDFQPVSGTLTFGPRQTTQTIAVPIIGDRIDEFNETFQVLLTNPLNATIANGGAPATGTIIDNDPPPVVSIGDTVVVEGNSSITSAVFSVSLSQASGKSICVQASTADGTATAASGDYAPIAGVITNPPVFLGFNPGTTSVTLSVPVRGDPNFEPNETFFANINPCDSNVTIGRGQAVATIINDDPQAAPAISISDVGVSDGSGATNAVFDVSLSSASTQSVTVQYATAPGTATPGNDYQTISGTLTFFPGMTHQPINVPIVGDALVEGNETFTVNLSNPTAGTLADSQGLCTISDGPPSQLPYLTINDITVAEGPSGTSDVDFTVTLSQPSAQQVFFQYTAAPGSATENVDYMKVFGGALIVPGSTTFKISVPIVGDQIVEADETFFINLSNATGATIADVQGVGTIVNYVTPSIQIGGGFSVFEDVGRATATITRFGNSLTTSVIDVATVDGTASQRTDYTISAATVTFLPGETTKTLDIPIVNDLYVEGDETFSLLLSNPVGAVLGDPSSVAIKILDDDSSLPNSNPLDNADARFFVREQYYDFLSRVPDQAGFDFWSGQITQCGSDALCIRNKKIDVSNAFFYELEYQQTGAYVYRLYRAAFGNNQPFPNPIPDPNNPGEDKRLLSYQAFSNDRARVVGGVSLTQSQLDLANAFAQRPEFMTRYPANLDDLGFVDAVLTAIRNDSGADLTSQRQALLDLFNQAGNGNAGRGTVMYRLADDNAPTNPINNRAFIDAEYNRAFVATQYFGYLRRDPDIAGFLFWLGQVNSAPLRDVPKQHAMVCSFTTSAEYQQRFSSVVTHFNFECQ